MKWKTINKSFILCVRYFTYIGTGRIKIRIHRDIEGKMWFGVG